jgi:CheY-like chemotaxis protein
MLVLAVDDDQEDLDVFCEAVKGIDSGIELITANNGEEALDFLTRKVVVMPDFVFLDINMPKIDGRDCLQKIRRNKSTRHLSVIVYSTCVSKSDKQLFESLNARFLTKASSYEALTYSLREIFGKLKAENCEVTSIFKRNQL